ncbi:MAG: alpha/beta hydrolase [Deltaproteobacteria bacterium]
MQRVAVAGFELEYVRYAGASPTLVLLHEGLGSVSSWREFPREVADATGHAVLVYSRAGYGGSDPVSLPRPLTYMHDEAFEVVPSLLEALALDDVVLIGHSDGGSIALLYASTEHGRQRVRGLVLEAPHVFTERMCVEAIERAKVAYETTDLRARLARHHVNVDVAFWGWNGAWLDPEFLRWNLEEHLPTVVAPTLLIQGRTDPYGTLEQLDRTEAGVSGEVERLVLDDCGHAPHRDRHDATLGAIVGFVQRLRGRGMP